MKTIILWVLLTTCTNVGSVTLHRGWIMTKGYRNLFACNIAGAISGMTYNCAEVGVWPSYEDLAKQAVGKECTEV